MGIISRARGHVEEVKTEIDALQPYKKVDSL